MAYPPFGPWRDGPSDPFQVTHASKLEGTVFAEFAEIEYAAAHLGFDPDGKELWELACAFGAHRIDLPFGTATNMNLSGAPMAGTPMPIPGERPPADQPFVPNAASASALQDLIAAEQHSRETGDKAEWAEPSAAEVVALRPLLRGG